MALVLYLETATDICSVALGEDGKVIEQRDAQKPYSHVSHINLLIQECLQARDVGFGDLDGVAISAGPGSYTGLRVGSSVAKGICFGRDIPLVSIATLEALAHEGMITHSENRRFYLCPLIDARRMEVYTATYDQNLTLIEQPRPLIVDKRSFNHLFQQGNPIIFMGNGMKKIMDLMPRNMTIFSNIICSASHLVPLAQKKIASAQYSDPSTFTPFYLKSPHITKAKKFI